MHPRCLLETITRLISAQSSHWTFQRRHFFGTNRIPSEESASIWALMWDAVQDQTLVILIVAAIVSLVFGLTLSDFDSYEWVEGVAILVSVVTVVFVASFNDYQKEKQFKALQAKQVSEHTICPRFHVVMKSSMKRMNKSWWMLFVKESNNKYSVSILLFD